MFPYLIKAAAAWLLVAVSFAGNKDASPANNSFVSMSDSIRLKYPCVYSFLKSTVFNNRSPHRIFIFKYFPARINMQIKLDEVDLPDSLAAESSIYTMTGDQYKETILLSSKTLKNASKEFIVATVTHELLHSFIKYSRSSYLNKQNDVTLDMLKKYFPQHWEGLVKKNPSFGDDRQHTLISENFIDAMRQYICQFTNEKSAPVVRDSVALALAWGGLHMTKAWRNLQADTCYLNYVDAWAKDIKTDVIKMYCSGCDTSTREFLNHLQLQSTCQ